MSIEPSTIERAAAFAKAACSHMTERQLSPVEMERVVVGALMAVPPFPTRLNATNAYRAWLKGPQSHV